MAPLPFNLIPNYVNLEPQYLNVAWDRGAKYHLPWQAGITGFAYNAAVTGRELRSINDLFDPEFAGQIGFFTEMRDTLGLVMLGQGNDPATATEDTMNEALDAIEEATPNGQIRRFTGNDYLKDIDNGNLQRWSPGRRHPPVDQSRRPLRLPGRRGDVVVRHDGDSDRRGQRGGRSAVDELRVRPRQRRPDHCVRAVRQPGGWRARRVGQARRRRGGAADSPLLFPDDETKAQLHVFADMPAELDQTITDRFVTITGG